MAQQSLSLPYLVLSGTIVLALVVSLALFRPQIAHWQAAREELTRLQTQAAERQAFLTTIDQKTAELQTHAAAAQELGVLVPSEEAFADVVRILDRHAGTAAVQIKKVDNTTATTQTAQRVAEALGTAEGATSTLTVHSATISVEGSYQQLRQFIGLLENTARFTDVPAIALSPSTSQPDLLSGSITINFYSL